MSEEKNIDMFEDYNNTVNSVLLKFKEYVLKSNQGKELATTRVKAKKELDEIKDDKLVFKKKYLAEKKQEFIQKNLTKFDIKIKELETKLNDCSSNLEKDLATIKRDDIEKKIKRNYKDILALKESSNLVDKRFKSIFGDDLYTIADTLTNTSLDNISFSQEDIINCEDDIVAINREVDFEKANSYIDYNKYIRKILGVPNFLKTSFGETANYIYIIFWSILLILCVIFSQYVLVPLVLVVTAITVTNALSNKKLLNAFVKSHRIFTMLNDATSDLDTQVSDEVNRLVDEVKLNHAKIKEDLTSELIKTKEDKEKRNTELLSEFNPSNYVDDVEKQYVNKINSKTTEIATLERRYAEYEKELNVVKENIQQYYSDSNLTEYINLFETYFKEGNVMLNDDNSQIRFDRNYFPKSLFYNTYTLKDEGYQLVYEMLNIPPLKKIDTLKINRRASIIFYDDEVNIKHITEFVRLYIHHQLSMYMSLGRVKFSFISDTPEAYFGKMAVQSDRPDEKKLLDSLGLYNFYNPNNESAMLVDLHNIARDNRNKVIGLNNFKTFEDYNEEQSKGGVGGQTNPLLPYNVLIYFKYSNVRVLNDANFIDLLTTTGGNMSENENGSDNVSGIMPFIFLNKNDVLTKKDDVDTYLRLFEFIHNENVFEVNPVNGELKQYSREDVLTRLNELKNASN